MPEEEEVKEEELGMGWAELSQADFTIGSALA